MSRYGTGASQYRHREVMEKIWSWMPLKLMKASASTTTTSIVVCFFFLLLMGAYVATRSLVSSFAITTDTTTASRSEETLIPKVPLTIRKVEFPLNCTVGNHTGTCPRNYPSLYEYQPSSQDHPNPPSCPDYFRWIYEDLRPWKHMGISRDVVERAKRTANFRLVIKDGRAYMERYQKSFQSRDVFTLWGILQLLRKYPGKVPDLELMFDCVDWPVIRSRDYRGPSATTPPPLFRYCGDDATLDIVFPDWSFWGW
ncbi:Glycosyl transferase CAP10 domain [Dillenia turbinata]|uniref:Glycosyl transferase CAP10 domain n=1 Tax=Dillenia turbinata TaxID=194707 RepID=A0AAN8V957_9MAGN